MENQAYISRVHLKGYKSIRDMEIDFMPGLNIIIGPNGSGKTNFVEHLSTSLFTNSGSTADNINNISAKIRFQDNEGHEDTYYCEIRKDKFKGFLQSEESEKVELKTENIGKLFEVHPNSLMDYFKAYSQFQERARTEFSSIFFPKVLKYGIDGFLRFLDSETKISIDFEEKNIDTHYYESPFENKFSAIFDFEKNTQKNYTEKKLLRDLKIKSTLVRCLERFSPIKNIRIRQPFVFNKYKNKIIIDFLLLEFYINDDWFIWKDLSDGTKRIFYIIAETLSTKGLVIIEEPELGLHPDQLFKLVDFIKEQSEDKQIIITTHAPEVLNVLDKDELDRIIITRYDNQTGTQMHKLSPHQTRKGQIYMKKVGYLSNFWVNSNLEEYEGQAAE